MSFLDKPISLFPATPRSINGIELNVVMTENTNDQLEITQQPVQQGAMIADHAFKKPVTLAMTAYRKSNFLSGVSLLELYEELLELQASRVPFVVKTPKRTYESMLLQTLVQTTDKTSENCLALTMNFQQIIIVPVETFTVDPALLKNRGSNQKTINGGNKSMLNRRFGKFGQ